MVLDGNPLWLNDGNVTEMMIEQNSWLKCLHLENSDLHVPVIVGVATCIIKNSVLKALHLEVSQADPRGRCMCNF